MNFSDFKASNGWLENFYKNLISKDFLVGSTLTIADFAVYSVLKQKFSQNGLVNLNKYFNSLSNNKCFQMAVSIAKEV